MKMTSAIIITIIGICITSYGIFQVFRAKAVKEANAMLSTKSEAIAKPEPANEGKEANNHEKGMLFEEYVVSLFDKKYFEITEWRGDKMAKDGRFATSNQYPDLEIKLNLKANSHLFAVECKYRSIATSSIKWSYPEQLERYKAFAKSKEMPVFIALGVGGSPDAPKYLNIIPLSEIEDESLTIDQLKPYRKETGSKFFYDADKGLLR